MSHTPGPWEVESSDMQTECYYIVNQPDMGDDEHEANAHLIAAAPDLLEALRYAAQQMAQAIDQDLNLGELHPDDFFEALNQAQAAIAKAEAQA